MKLVFKREAPDPSGGANGPLFQSGMLPGPDRLSDQLCHRRYSGLQMLSDVETDQGPPALAAVIRASLTVHTRSVGAVTAEGGAARSARDEVHFCYELYACLRDTPFLH